MTERIENFFRQIPEGEDRERDVCATCGFINYVNPRIVVGIVSFWGEQVLLCRRAIHPRKGFWTLPAGFMEEGETVEAAALREAREEACITPEIDRILAVYSVPHISQVQIMFLGSLKDLSFAPGPESLDVQLFAFDSIPWDSLAFPSVHWALRQAYSVRGQSEFAPFANPYEPMGLLSS